MCLPTSPPQAGFLGLPEELRWLSGLPPWAMAGEGTPALCMATRSKALLHGPEGWASCCLGPTSWGREPGKEETWIPEGMLMSFPGDRCV